MLSGLNGLANLNPLLNNNHVRWIRIGVPTQQVTEAEPVEQVPVEPITERGKDTFVRSETQTAIEQKAGYSLQDLRQKMYANQPQVSGEKLNLQELQSADRARMTTTESSDLSKILVEETINEMPLTFTPVPPQLNTQGEIAMKPTPKETSKTDEKPDKKKNQEQQAQKVEEKAA